MSKSKTKFNLDHYIIQAGALPEYDVNEPNAYKKKINKRIRENFKLNAKLLEARHAEHAAAIRVNIESGRVQAVKLQSAYNTFKAYVTNFMKEGYNLNEAIRKTFRTTFFLPRRISGPQNLLAKIKKVPDIYHEFRKAIGWKNKVLPRLFKAIGHGENGYIYDERVKIVITESPEMKKKSGQVGLKIYKLNNEKWVEQASFKYDRDVWMAMDNIGKTINKKLY